MLQSKQRLVVEKLRELRKSSPTFPMVSQLDFTRPTPKRSPSAPPPPSPGPVAAGFLASSPSTPAPTPIHPVDSPSTLFSSALQCMCMSCNALEKRVEGLELAVRLLQAQMSQMYLHPQATSSAALASPSPSTPRTHTMWNEYMNTGPTVAQSPQPQPSVPFSYLSFMGEDFCVNDDTPACMERHITTTKPTTIPYGLYWIEYPSCYF
ncbi:unnamed protein product [Boreogadus saida]